MAPKKPKMPKIQKPPEPEPVAEPVAEPIADQDLWATLLMKVKAGEPLGESLMSHDRFQALAVKLLELCLSSKMMPDGQRVVAVGVLLDTPRHLGGEGLKSRLVELSLAKDPVVRANVAAVLPQAGDDGLAALRACATDRSTAVRAAVAKALPASDPCLQSLLDDETVSVRLAAAAVLRGSPALLARRCDPDARIRALAFSLTPEAVEALDPAARSAAIREGLADRHPAVVKAAGEMVFNWYAKAGVRVLGAMPEAEAEVAVPHLLERDGDGLDRVAKQALARAGLLESEPAAKKAKKDAPPSPESFAGELILIRAGAAKFATMLEDVDAAKLLALIPTAMAPVRKQMLMLYEKLDVRDEALREQHAALCLDLLESAEPREEDFPLAGEPRRWCKGWAPAEAELDVCMRAPGLDASRIVSRISDMLDDKVRPLLTQLKTAYARREDATRRDADLAKAVVEDAAHGALLESQREAMQAELMEAKELFCAAEGDLIVGWQKLLCWVAGVLRSPHAGASTATEGCLQELLPQVIKPATKPPLQTHCKKPAIRALALFALRGTLQQAREYMPYFETICANSMPGMLAGNEEATQLCALGFSALSELELRCEVESPKTVTFCLRLARPDLAAAIPTWFHRLAVELGGVHLLRGTAGGSGAPLLAYWLQRLWSARGEAEDWRQEKHLLYHLIGSLATRARSLVVDAVALAAFRHPNVPDLVKRLAPALASDGESVGRVAWVLAAEAEGANGAGIAESVAELLMTAAACGTEVPDWNALLAWVCASRRERNLPEGLEFLALTEKETENAPALAPPVASVIDDADAAEAKSGMEDVDPSFADDGPADATMDDLKGAMMDLLPMTLGGQDASLEYGDFAGTNAKIDGGASTTYTHLLEAAREGRKERHARLTGDLRGLLDMFNPRPRGEAA